MVRRICAGALALALAMSAHAACKIAQLAEWPVTTAHNRPFVQGKINGQAVTVLIDTGSDASFVPERAATELGLPLGGVPNLRVFGAGGEAKAAGTLIKELQIGAYTATSVQLLALGDERGMHDVGLVLGDEFFTSFATEFDIPDGVIRLLRPQGCKADQLAYWSQNYSLANLAAAKEERPSIVVDILINGKHVDALLDTGAPTSIIDAGAIPRVGGKPLPGQSRETSAGLAEKSFETWIGIFDSVSIGDETIRNVRLRVGNLWGKNRIATTGSHIAQQVEDPEMLLGFDFLLSHRVLVLPKERAAVFTYNGGPLFQSVAPEETATAASAPKAP